MIGYSSLFLSLLVTCIAAFSYFNLHFVNTRRHLGKERIGNFGLQCYRLSAALVCIAASYLLYIILDNNFEYAYVFSYSSRDLAWPYKISAFWAGQQGSFMLWLVFHVILGLLLSHKNDAPSGVMAVYSMLQAMLLTVLLVKGPFMLLAPHQVDGVGLNPLLQDFWMIIHPPIIFLGYAGLAVPFAYALEGLFSNKHNTWATAALPWALFSWCALGAGVFIGGFWAYKVLGWGGYWAWDPVENSSLVPWLVAGALVHSLFWAQLRPAALKGAYLASIFSFVTVLYGTFLTRSGILSDFSTHSFVDEGIGGLLAGLVLITLCCGVVMLIIRWPNLPDGQLYSSINSREFFLGCSVLVLTVMSIMVCIGMSTPLITMLMGNPSNVSESFYNNTSLPLAASLVMLLTVAPIVSHYRADTVRIKQYWWLAGIALLSLTLPFKLGLYHPMIVGTIVFSVTALIINMTIAGRNKRLSWPAAIAHAGLAILVIGILVSSAASQSVMLMLDGQQSKNIFETNITYLGTQQASDGSGLYQEFKIEGQGIENAVIGSFTKYNKDGKPSAREPGIYRGWLADLYVAPVMQQDDHVAQEIVFHKGENSLQNGVNLKFIGIQVSGGNGNSEMRMQALFEGTKGGKTETFKPELVYKNNTFIRIPITILGQYEVSINSVNPREGMVNIAFIDHAIAAKTDRVEVEISHKPFINLVWLGSILITLGSGWAAVNRFILYRQVLPNRPRQELTSRIQ